MRHPIKRSVLSGQRKIECEFRFVLLETNIREDIFINNQRAYMPGLMLRRAYVTIAQNLVCQNSDDSFYSYNLLSGDLTGDIKSTGHEPSITSLYKECRRLILTVEEVGTFSVNIHFRLSHLALRFTSNQQAKFYRSCCDC